MVGPFKCGGVGVRSLDTEWLKHKQFDHLPLFTHQKKALNAFVQNVIIWLENRANENGLKSIFIGCLGALT